MSYAVLVSALRAAAGLYEGIGSDLGTTPVVIDHIEPDSLGHVELAAWLTAVDEQVHNAHAALHSGVTGLATSLRVAAVHYETTDDNQVDLYRPLPYLLGPGGGSPSPLPYPLGVPGTPTPVSEPPVYGPSVPGTEG